jgi:hypothetical protein
LRNFKVGDWVYAHDWCYGQVVRIEGDIALVMYDNCKFCSFMVDDLKKNRGSMCED